MPPEIIRMCPLDAPHDKMLPNKNATPVVGEKSLAELAEDMDNRRWNAVVCERSSRDEGDIVAQNRSSLEHIVRTLQRWEGPGSDDGSAPCSDGEGAGEETEDDAEHRQGDVRDRETIKHHRQIIMKTRQAVRAATRT